MAQENVNVVVRIRPSSNETNDETCIQTDPISSTITLTTNEKQFHMDKVFEQNAPQEEIFEYVQPIIAAVKNGIHGTIFAYGQTGSGKTHTMIGNDKNLGIIPRAIEIIFTDLNEESKKRNDNFKFKISCTALQIYCEKTYDLLNGNEKIEIPLRDIFKNAKEIEVKSSNECMEIIKRGLKQRKVAGTSMNETSSRSHAILTLTLKTEYFKENKKHERISRLNMVDLAGSEKHTDNNKTQNREAANINKSLSTLGQVIRAIINPTPKQVIPYRDSKLTTILRDSLGGNSKTTVIVNIHSNSKYAAETSSTLDFAANVKNVKNTAILQEFITSKETFTLKAEVQRLGEENDKLKIELAKEKKINPITNKINTLEKELNDGKNSIFQLENQIELFELKENKNKLESELKKAKENQKKCEFEIAEMKLMIDVLENENQQLKKKVQTLEIKNDQIKNQRNSDDNFEQPDTDSDCICLSETETSSKKSNEISKKTKVQFKTAVAKRNVKTSTSNSVDTEILYSFKNLIIVYDWNDPLKCYRFIKKRNAENYLCENCYRKPATAKIWFDENNTQFANVETKHHPSCEPSNVRIFRKPNYKIISNKNSEKKLYIFEPDNIKFYYEYFWDPIYKFFVFTDCIKPNVAVVCQDSNGKEYVSTEWPPHRLPNGAIY
uniref:Kinesin-like protein n=1 Tax=Panagrolaimus davidi TaxID=227884 RepID=A0A914QHX8_9BILA